MVRTITYHQRLCKTVKFQFIHFRKESHKSFTHGAADGVVFIEQTGLGEGKKKKKVAQSESKKKRKNAAL